MTRKFPITISIDEATLRRLDKIATHAKLSRSEIVRHLINDTDNAADREEERIIAVGIAQTEPA